MSVKHKDEDKVRVLLEAINIFCRQLDSEANPEIQAKAETLRDLCEANGFKIEPKCVANTL